MNKQHLIVTFSFVFSVLTSIVFPEIPLPNGQTITAGPSIVLQRPSAERIARKEKQFKQLLASYERNQIIVAACVGAALGIAAGLVLEHFFKPWKQPNGAPANVVNILNELDQQNVRMLNDLQLQYLQERAERTTLKGRLKWASDNVVSMVLCGLAGTAATKIMGSLIPGLKSGIYSLIGDQQLIIADACLNVMRNIQKLAQSLRACEQVSSDVGNDDQLLGVFKDYKIRNLIVDHHMFIDSFENFIALLFVIHEMMPENDTHQKAHCGIFATAFLECIEPIIDRQEKALAQFKASGHIGDIKAVIGGLRNMYGECGQLLHYFGSVSDDNDEKNVAQEAQ